MGGADGEARYAGQLDGPRDAAALQHRHVQQQVVFVVGVGRDARLHHHGFGVREQRGLGEVRGRKNVQLHGGHLPFAAQQQVQAAQVFEQQRHGLLGARHIAFHYGQLPGDGGFGELDGAVEHGFQQGALYPRHSQRPQRELQGAAAFGRGGERGVVVGLHLGQVWVGQGVAHGGQAGGRVVEHEVAYRQPHREPTRFQGGRVALAVFD